MTVHRSAAFGALAVALVTPLVFSEYIVHVLILALFYGFLGTAWNILGGYAGQMSFGHAAFFGLGAYTSTLLFVNAGVSPWVGMVVGGFVGMVAGVGMGWLTFRYRLRGIYFSMATLAFSELIRLVALNWDQVGGAVGILIPLGAPSVGAFQFGSKLPFYYTVLGLLLLGLLVTYRLQRSVLGDYLIAVREDEDAAEAVGINAQRAKLFATALSTFLTALGGTFYAQYLLYVQPDFIFGVGMSIEIVLGPIIGGMGTLLGPLLGALMVGPMGEVVRSYFQAYNSLYMVFYGTILIVIILYSPAGLVGWARLFMCRNDRQAHDDDEGGVGLVIDPETSGGVR